MGTHGAILRSFRRWGQCSYGYGAHPLHVAFYALKLMHRRRPRVIGGLNYLAGWSLALIRRAPRADAELRRAVRREQMAKGRGRLEGLLRRLGTLRARERRSSGFVKWVALIVIALLVGAVAFLVLHRGDELAAPAGRRPPPR